MCFFIASIIVGLTPPAGSSKHIRSGSEIRAIPKMAVQSAINQPRMKGIAHVMLQQNEE
jgi:hypothetical protein